MLPKILVVDDSDYMRKAVELTLKQFPCDPVFAENGKQGLYEFESGQVDLIITDVNMPEMDGLTMAKEIRKKNKDIPIIVVTTESEESIKTEGRQIGIDGWLVKPFSANVLIALLKDLLE